MKMYFLLMEREMAWIFKFSIHSLAFVYSVDFLTFLFIFISFCQMICCCCCCIVCIIQSHTLSEDLSCLSCHIT